MGTPGTLVPEGLLHHMLDGVPHAVVSFDATWRLLAANRRFDDCHPSCRSLADVVHPDDLATLNDVCRPTGSHVATIRLVTAEGRTSTVVATVTPAAAGACTPQQVWVAALVPVDREVAFHAAAAAAEDRLRWLLHALPIGVALIDPDGVLVQANPALLRLLGGPEAELLGRPLRAHYQPSGPGHLTGGRLVVEGWPVASRRAGALRVTLIDQAGPDGTVLAVVEEVADAVVQAGVEGRRQRLAAVARAGAGMAHHINTPLQYVGDNIRFAIDAAAAVADTLTDSGAEVPGTVAALADLPDALADAHHGVERIREVTAALQGLNPVDPPAVEEADLVVLARQALAECDADPAVADMVLLAPACLPLRCRPAQITRLLVELVSNAVDAVASTDGRGDVVIELAHVDDHAIVTVGDDGPGLSEAAQARLFEPFAGATPGAGRLGLGLATVHAITITHDGTLHCDSQPGQGALFTVRLPVDGPRER